MENLIVQLIAVGGGVGGAILLVIVGVIKKAMSRQTCLLPI